MRTTTRTIVATSVVAMALVLVATIGANQHAQTMQDYRDRMDVLLVERSVRFACRVIESGPTGPEPSVTIGQTISQCVDGTTRIDYWHMSDGTIYETTIVGGDN
jgi:hypothetical protein